jgi:phosphoglycerate dehydrogenase-like enzyme
MRLRIVTAVHNPPVWSLPDSEARRIAVALPQHDVVDARTAEDRRREFPAADVILSARMTSEDARLCERVKWIQSTAVGVGSMLVPEIIERDIIVTNARGCHSEPIAEHAIAMALAVRRSLHTAVRRQIDRVWAQEELQIVPCPPISNSRVLVVGLGEIGRRVAKLAAGLGFTVTGLRRRLDQPTPDGVGRVIGVSELLTELPQTDVLILAAPRTSETGAMIGRAEFAAMKPTTVLVNVGRGRLVDESALVEALSTHRIGGAAIDAFEREPVPSDHPLWTLPNVLLTPHIAAFGSDYWKPAVDLFLENVSRFTAGKPLLNLVDKRSGY